MEEVAEGFLAVAKVQQEEADDFKQAGYPETNQTCSFVGDRVSLSSQSQSLREERAKKGVVVKWEKIKCQLKISS